MKSWKSHVNYYRKSVGTLVPCSITKVTNLLLHKSFISMRIILVIPTLKSRSWLISRFARNSVSLTFIPSHTRHFVIVTIITFTIHHSFSLSFKVSNSSPKKILLTIDCLPHPPDNLTDFLTAFRILPLAGFLLSACIHLLFWAHD